MLWSEFLILGCSGDTRVLCAHCCINQPKNKYGVQCTVYSVQCTGGFIKGILRGVRCTKSLRVLFLHRRPPSWTTLVLYSRAVFIFNEPAYFLVLQPPQYHKSQTSGIITVHIHVLYKGCLCHIVQYCLAQ